MATLVVLWGQYLLGWLPPAILPFVAGLVLLGASLIVALVLGVWRVLAGPRRLHALILSALAAVPVLLLAGPCEYARRQWGRRQVPADVIMRTGSLIGASAMRAVALYEYPRGEETEHLVMLYDQLERPREDALAMEAHVADMEAKLKRKLPSKVVWVRGPLLGEDNVSFHGLALGSQRSPDDWSSVIDQHELAHATLDLLRSPWADPPMFLHEGWAELNGGSREGQLDALAREAVEARKTGQWVPLTELVGPDWYHKDRGPVYWEGHLFVDFLVHQHGIESFFELYNTSRPATFPADCLRILGKDLKTLEAELWKEIGARLAEADDR